LITSLLALGAVTSDGRAWLRAAHEAASKQYSPPASKEITHVCVMLTQPPASPW